MFENVEEKLKKYAKVNSVCVFIIGFFLVYYFFEEVGRDISLFGVLLGWIAIAAIVYCLLATCWFMYAFAEIVESTKKTNEALRLAFSKNISEEEQRKRDAEAAQKAAEAARIAYELKQQQMREAEEREIQRQKDLNREAYWAAHAKEKEALLAKRNEAEAALESLGPLANEEKKALQALIESIDVELTKDR